MAFVGNDQLMTYWLTLHDDDGDIFGETRSVTVINTKAFDRVWRLETESIWSMKIFHNA